VAKQVIKMGVIGCGHWGSNHVRVFSQLNMARVLYAADANASRRNLVKRLYPSIHVTADYRILLKDRELDAVVIATPTSSHFKIVQESLERGKHVLCEKPLTANLGQAEKLLNLAKKNRRLLFVGHTFIFNLGIQRLREYLMKKHLGKIHYIRSLRTNLGPIREDVNVVWDLAAHDISILSYLLDKDPVEVAAKGAVFLQKGIEDIAIITLTYPNNIIANIQVSWLDPRKVREITIVGSKKMAIWNDLSAAEPIRIYDKGVLKERDYNTFGEFHYLSRDGDVLIPKVRLVEPLQVEAEAFLRALVDKKDPISDGQLGVRVVRTLERIQESIRKGGSPVR